MNIFGKLNIDIFKPLTGKNRERYADILSLLWDECRKKPVYALNKSEMISLVELYFEGYGTEIAFDEDEIPEESDGDIYRTEATAFIRRLRDTGWLVEREQRYEEEIQYALNHQVVPILKSFAEIINPRIITYKGKLFEIYTMLSNIGTQDNPYENILRVVEDDMVELNLSLRQLSASIEDYIDELTKGKSPEDILELFEKYEEKIVLGAYQRFKTNDNLYYYKQSLFDMLDFCEGEYFDTVVNDCIAVDHIDDIDARLKVKNTLKEIRSELEAMEEIMVLIDDRHILYRTRAVQRAQFMILNDSSTKGRINALLQFYASEITTKDVANEEDDTEVASIFQVFGQNYYDGQSLATPYKRRKPTPIDVMQIENELDMAVIQEQHDRLVASIKNALTSENVNSFATKVLASGHAISASSVLNDSSLEGTIEKIIGLYTYSTSSKRQFEVKMLEQYVTYENVRFRDFVIERKQ